MFDSIFLADQLALGDDVDQAARTWLEPITVLAAVAAATSRIGMIATASTTYTEPFNLARQFGSLDHISNGRVGWNIVTSWLATAARNFGGTGQVSHADRYARGEEFMTVVKALWDSWADDAVIDNRDSGRYARADRIRPINHKGQYYQVAGPLNLPRCPQGRPVFVQAGSSDTGRRFAARHAEAVFTAHMEKATAQAFYADLKALVAAEGRTPGQVLILPGLSPMIASTEAEAQRMARETNELSDPEVGRKRLCGRFGGHDFSHLPLDRPLVPDDFPPPASVEAARSRTEVILSLVRREKPTLRQLLANLAGARGHFTFAGTPEQVADIIEDWFTDGAADGFNIMLVGDDEPRALVSEQQRGRSADTGAATRDDADLVLEAHRSASRSTRVLDPAKNVARNCHQHAVLIDDLDVGERLSLLRIDLGNGVGERDRVADEYRGEEAHTIVA